MRLINSFDNPIEVVMGFNEKAASHYVTWLVNPNQPDAYHWGHYFSSKEDAMKDFFERGMREASLDFREIYRTENALEDIQSALEWPFNSFAVECLLNNETFKEHALHRYYNIDHSAENEALSETLESLYNEMVEKNEIFPFDVIESSKDEPVTVNTLTGESLRGKASFFPKDSLSRFVLKVPSEPGEKMEYVDFEIENISYIQNDDGESIFTRSDNSLENKISRAKEYLPNSDSKEQHMVNKELVK